MERWNASINVYQHEDMPTTFSIRIYSSSNRRGFLSPVKRVTGRIAAPPAADPTRYLRGLLEALREQI